MSSKTSIKRQRVALTNLLQNTIKTLRKEHNIRGDILSKKIGKGASYISQIENGKMQEIDFDIILKIFHVIIDLPSSDFNEYMKNYIFSIFLNISKDELLKEYWIHIFVIQELQYPVTDWIISFIDNKLNKLNITPTDLTEEINANHELRRWSYDSLYYIENKAYVNTNKNTLYLNEDKYDLTIWVRYAFSDNYISSILSKETTTINYINMFIIFKTLFILEDDNRLNLHDKITKIMEDTKFFNAFEIYDNIHQSSLSKPDTSISPTETERSFTFYDDLIIDYQKKYANLKENLFKELEYALNDYYYANSAYSCEAMENVLKNFTPDAGLIMAVLSSPIYNISHNQRPYFFKEYKKLLQKYADLN